MHKRLLNILIILILTFNTSNARNLQQIKQSGVIYIAFTQSSRNSINYQIAEEFAKFLHVKLVPVITTWEENFSNNGYLPPDLQTNPNYHYTPDALKKADLICGTIYVYEWRKKLFDYAGISQVSDILIVRKQKHQWSFLTKSLIPEEYLNLIHNPSIKNYNDLKGKKIALLQNSSYEKNISRINKKLGNKIIIIRTKSEEESQKLLKEGKVDGFVAVSYLALKFLNDNPNIAKLAFPVGKPFDVGWAIQKGNKKLAEEINNFFETIKGNGTLDKLFQKNYGIDYNTYLDIINSYSEANFNSVRDLDEIIASGKIIVGLRDRELIYHPTGKKQFSERLAEEFAKYLNLELEFKIAPSISTYFENDKGKIIKDSSYTPEFFKKVDVACDILAPLPWRLKKVDIVPYLPNAIVVVGKKNKKISTISDLKKLRGVTAKGSSYEQALINNGIKNYFYAPLNQNLKLVQEGKADYTLVSISIYNLPNYPDLEAKFILGEIQKNGWAIKRNHPKLKQKILEFFEYANKYGILDDLFKDQTGMPFRAAEQYLIALHQTYNIGYFPFVFYGTDQGLPQEDVICIYQDKDGYIWFGTFAGAVRFNGRKMTIINTKNNLPSNEVFDIKQDKNGDIYFATLKGIAKLHSRKKVIPIIKNVPFKHIFIDQQNRKWFFGDNGIYLLSTDTLINLSKAIKNMPISAHAITQIDNHTFLIGSNKGLYLFDYYSKNIKKILNDFIFYVFIDNDDYVWLSTKSGIYHTKTYLVKQGKITNPINKQTGIKEVIHQIYQTKDGAIWLISNFKAYQIFTLKQAPIIYDTRVGLLGQKIYCFFVDNENNLWFGLAGGAEKLTNKSLRIIYPEKLKFYVNNIIQDNRNQFWFAFNNSLYVLSDSLINLTNKLAKSFQSFAITQFNKNILIATTTGLYLIDPKTLSIIQKRTFKNALSYVQNIFVSSKNEIFILSGRNGIIYYLKNFYAPIKPIENEATTLTYQLYEHNDTIIGTSNSGIIFFDGTTFKYLIKSNMSVWSINKIKNNIYLGTEKGLYILKNNKLKKISITGLPDSSINALSPAIDTNFIWLGTNKGFCYLNLKKRKVEFSIDAKDGLPGNEIATNGLVLDDKGKLWIGTLHGIATYDINKKDTKKYAPDCRIESIYLNEKNIDSLPKKLKYFQNNISFELTGLSFKNEESLVYDYYLRGNDKIYKSSSGVPYLAAYQNLPPGNYTFLYRAKGKDGIWSYYKAINFEILKPFWLQWWFIILMIISLIIIMFIIIKLRERALKLRNEELEKIVRERTKQIEMQKAAIEAKNAELQQQQEEIIAQRDELARQRDIAQKQRDEIAKQQEEIMDSIYYAKRIQAAMLPPLETVKQYIPEFFVLYKPRDIVSGDFYWFKKIGNKIIVVAGDCTGHGVPGAFMSMLGVALLDEIIWQHKENLIPGKILDKLRKHIVEALHQTGKIEETKDGMDMSLYIIDTQNHILQFAGAFNPLYIARNDELIEIPADRMPIGIFENVQKNFTTHTIKVQKGDMLYTFSDGYASQFGGKKGKKFKNSRLKKLFLAIKDKPVDEQKRLLEETLENWMGVKYKQIDDILIIGVRYTWGNENNKSHQEAYTQNNITN